MTKEILLITDERAGHINQSKALAKELIKIFKQRYAHEKILQEIFQPKFRSRVAKFLFSLYALLVYPLTKKNIPFLSLFIKNTEELENKKPQIVISAGAKALPLNLLVSKKNKAKRLILMNPAFPFYLFRYDLAVIPLHDKPKLKNGVLQRTFAPSAFDEELILKETDIYRNVLTHPERVKIGLLIGGDSKNYKFNTSAMDLAIERLVGVCEKLNIDFIATTCRRTPKNYEIILKEKLEKVTCCQLLVLASKKEASNFVSAMLGLCAIIIAPEESISMISEPIAAGKRPLILKLGKHLNAKYRRFHNFLVQKKLAYLVSIDNFADTLAEVYEKKLYNLDQDAKEKLILEEEVLRERLLRLL